MSQILLFTVLLVLFSIFSSNVSAQSRWKMAAVSDKGIISYIDEKLIQQPNGNILGWEKVGLPPTLSYPSGSYFVSRSEWDCGSRTTRRLQAFIYDRYGKFIETFDVDTSWKETPPDSVGEIIINQVCKTFKSKNSNSSPQSPSRSSFAEIIKKSSLMSEAKPSSEVIRKVAIGEKLALISKESTGVWYRVLDPKTNSEGWLNGNHFKIVEANKSTKRSKNRAGKSN